MTRYELLDRIGVGGMAEIFRGRAVAAGGFQKPVAIKRILPHLAQDRRFVELLIAEAKVTSLLKHRNIVQIFDVGLGDDGKYFLVMEYVDGVDLGAVQRALEQTRRRIPYALALHVGAEICEALDHAHTTRGPDGRPMSLVHRDVSPSNVLLSRAGEVKLTDFGIAKRAEADVTHGGAVRGKFAYISPEQARNEHLDPRSDVFSVGILVWELLTNRRLFSGLGDLEALRAVRNSEPIPTPTSVDPRLPREVDALVMTALARDVSRRFATAGELGQQLRGLRYSLDATVGDPSTELARLVESALEVARESRPSTVPVAKPARAAGVDFDGSEATVIRIRTADGFGEAEDDNNNANASARIAAARKVIGEFEDEETRLAQISGDQLRQLRAAGPAAEHDGSTRPKRPRRPSDEATRARSPLDVDPRDEPPSRPGRVRIEVDTPNAHLTPTDETKLVVSRDRRTPPPQRVVRKPSSSQNPVAPVAPLTLDEPVSHSHSVTNAPLTLDEPVDDEPMSRSYSQSVSRSQSRSQPSIDTPPQSPPAPASPQPLTPGAIPTPSALALPMTPAQVQQMQAALQAQMQAALAAQMQAAQAAQAAQAQGQPPSPPSAPVLPVQPMPQPPSPTPANASPPNFGGWGPPVAAQRPSNLPTNQPTGAPSHSTGAPSQPGPRGTVAGPRRSKRSTHAPAAMWPWLLLIGALIVALAAFAITRAVIR